MKIKVRAIAKGFYGNQIRNEDDEFHVAKEHAKSRWYIPLEEINKVNAPKAEPTAAVVDMPESEEAALRLTNPQLQALLQSKNIKFADSSTKKELVALLFRNAADDEDTEQDSLLD